MALFGGKDSSKEKASKEKAATGTQREPMPTSGAPQPEMSNAGSSRRAEQGSQQGGVTVANIGKSIAIKGDLTGNEDMVIEGRVDGSIDLPNNQLTIGGDGSVQAEIHAKSVVVIGHVAGNINGIERVEIQGSGRVEGNVSAPKLIVAEGAQIDGTIQMSGTAASVSPEASPRSAQTSPTSPTSVPSEEVRKTA